MGATIIHQGAKLDNLIQVAHNVEIGRNTVMAAQGGIAGSTQIGEWCMFGGQVGIAGHIQIGDKVKCGAQAGITGNVKSGETIIGSPAIDSKNFVKSFIYFKHLPETAKEIKDLKKDFSFLPLRLTYTEKGDQGWGLSKVSWGLIFSAINFRGLKCFQFLPALWHNE